MPFTCNIMCYYHMNITCILGIPYTHKFSRDVIFTVFAGNLSSTKIKSSNFFKTITMHIELKG